MLWLIVAGSFICATSLVLYLGRRQLLPTVEERLIKHQTAVVDVSEPVVMWTAENNNTLNPLLKKLLGQFGSVIYRNLPRQYISRSEQKLAMAGGFANLTAAEFIAMRITMAVGLSSIWAILSRGQCRPTFLVEICLIAWFFPRLMLDSKITKRQKQIRKCMPDAVDLLTVSVEAGLGFDSALQRVAAKMSGPLCEEFRHYLRSVRMGAHRRIALKEMGQRVGIPELNSFVVAIVQADQLGVSIGKVLRVQSEEMRRRRRQKAEELAMKAPIKMLFPLIFCIFPSIFLVLLGPAAINIMNLFMSMKIGR